MNRVLLVLIGLLAALLAVGRMGAVQQPTDRSEGDSPTPSQAVASRPAPATLRPTLVSLETLGPKSTPLIDQMARLEARRRLGFFARHTYLDSMLVATDSTLRRWPDRGGAPLRVAIALPPGDTRGPRLVEVVTEALKNWERQSLGIQFAVVDDSVQTDIAITWIDQFPVGDGANPEGARQTGLTSLLADGRGGLQLARVVLSLSDGRGHNLSDDEIRQVATHEVGHALGLPHSGSREDIMYPTVLADQVSDRDWASLTLLYTLPPGPLREPPSP